jgi:hypothetical protein
MAQASRWAHGRAKIDPRSLLLLQLHAYGAVLPQAWLSRGIRVQGEDLRTETGQTVTTGEISGFAWLRDHYKASLQTLLEEREAARLAASTPPGPTAEIIAFEDLRAARLARQRPAGPPETKNPA